MISTSSQNLQAESTDENFIFLLVIMSDSINLTKTSNDEEVGTESVSSEDDRSYGAPVQTPPVYVALVEGNI